VAGVQTRNENWTLRLSCDRSRGQQSATKYRLLTFTIPLENFHDHLLHRAEQIRCFGTVSAFNWERFVAKSEASSLTELQVDSDVRASLFSSVEDCPQRERAQTAEHSAEIFVSAEVFMMREIRLARGNTSRPRKTIRPTVPKSRASVQSAGARV
jgi:hypothetical protein